MAPAQVLPNEVASTTVKKQKLLLAGKERLAAYRREKALEKERKAAASRQTQDTSDNQSSQTAQGAVADPGEVGHSSEDNGFTDDSLKAISSGSEAVHPVGINDHVSYNGAQYSPPPTVKENGSYVQLHTADQETRLNGAWSHNPKTAYEVAGNNKGTPEEYGISDGRQRERIISEPIFQNSASSEKDSSSERNTYSSFSHYDDSKKFLVISPEGSGTSPGERKIDISFNFVPTPYSAPSTNSEPIPSTFLSDRSFSDYALTDIAKNKITSRKFRPSFLDSIRMSSPTPFPSPVGGNQINSDNSNTPPDLSNLSMESTSKMVEAFSSAITSSNSGKSLDFPIYSNNESYQFNGIANENRKEYENPYHSVRQNEDFSALEQHIEDLTQEKFSLQRAVEASRTLAESLAAENSALTDSYNQQGSVVNQLKGEMEKLQEEIRGQSVELEALKSEYGNVLLECNAADERARLLASEVISLEEKALRLRSNELKLERQLENALSEVSSLKKKMTSLERERQDLQASISAYQEEKMMLQSKLKNLAPTGSHNVNKSTSNKRDASTSTDDIVNEDSAWPVGTVDSFYSHIHNAGSSSDNNSLRSTSFLENSDDLQFGSSSIPSDQIGVIQNINALLSELALEKEELINTLKAESSECSKFKELNKELSKRLEIQTQRLELLTAQNMAQAQHSVSTKQPDYTSTEVDNRRVYADEGDEVVERVLSWIMKLFPGGPSKRRLSSHI